MAYFSITTHRGSELESYGADSKEYDQIVVRFLNKFDDIEELTDMEYKFLLNSLKRHVKQINKREVYMCRNCKTCGGGRDLLPAAQCRWEVGVLYVYIALCITWISYRPSCSNNRPSSRKYTKSCQKLLQVLSLSTKAVTCPLHQPLHRNCLCRIFTDGTPYHFSLSFLSPSFLLPP